MLPGWQYARGWEWFIPVYRLGEDGGLHFNEGADMLMIWLLRARSYKTKTEA